MADLWCVQLIPHDHKPVAAMFLSYRNDSGGSQVHVYTSKEAAEKAAHHYAVNVRGNETFEYVVQPVEQKEGWL